MLTFSCRSPESAFDSVSYLLLPAGPPLIPVQKTTTSHKSISGRLPGRTYPKVVMMQEAFKGQGFTSCMLTWRRVGGGGGVGGQTNLRQGWLLSRNAWCLLSTSCGIRNARGKYSETHEERPYTVVGCLMFHHPTWNISHCGGQTLKEQSW